MPGSIFLIPGENEPIWFRYNALENKALSPRKIIKFRKNCSIKQLFVRKRYQTRFPTTDLVKIRNI